MCGVVLFLYLFKQLQLGHKFFSFYKCRSRCFLIQLKLVIISKLKSRHIIRNDSVIIGWKGRTFRCVAADGLFDGLVFVNIVSFMFHIVYLYTNDRIYIFWNRFLTKNIFMFFLYFLPTAIFISLLSKNHRPLSPFVTLKKGIKSLWAWSGLQSEW